MLANVKTALAARGMRQAQLAQTVGLPESTLSEFIHERCGLAPHFRTRIAEALQADPAWLFSRLTQIPELRPAAGEMAAGTAATAAA
jgi:transcriptional regulator with XRE-family HTH domain